MNSATRAAIKMIEETKSKSGTSMMDELRKAWGEDKKRKGAVLPNLLRSGFTVRASPFILASGCPIGATALVHFLEMVEWDFVAQAVSGGAENN